MLGGICTFFHLGKHYKFLKAINSTYLHSLRNCTCKRNMGPKSSQMIILKISYNSKSHLIRTPGYLIRFPNYQDTNAPQTSCKSGSGRVGRKWLQACCLILSLPAAALWRAERYHSSLVGPWHETRWQDHQFTQWGCRGKPGNHASEPTGRSLPGGGEMFSGELVVF